MNLSFFPSLLVLVSPFFSSPDVAPVLTLSRRWFWKFLRSLAWVDFCHVSLKYHSNHPKRMSQMLLSPHTADMLLSPAAWRFVICWQMNSKRWQTFCWFTGIVSLRKGGTKSACPCWPECVPLAMLVPMATSVTGAWHFLQTGTGETLSCPAFLSSFSSLLPWSLLALLYFSVVLGKRWSSLLIFPSLCLSLSLSWQPHFLFAVFIAASLSLFFSLILSLSLFPLSDSASPCCFLFLHVSSSFCSLPVSKPLSPYLALLSALPVLCEFQTLPPLVFHSSLIHNKTGLHLERVCERKYGRKKKQRESVCVCTGLFPHTNSCIISSTSTVHFLSFSSQSISAAVLEAKKLAKLQFSWYAFCWAE